MTKKSINPTIWRAVFVVALVAAFALGPSVASVASASPVAQQEQGDINGVVTAGGQSASGMQVELRQRTNGGGDTTLATTKTDSAGAYHFRNQPSAPNDAFYYLRYSGGSGTLAAWYSFPVIYLSGTEVTVPAVDMADVQIVEPGQDVTLQTPGTLRWNLRKMGETYRVLVYASGKTDKPVLDSGSLGTGTQFVVADGALPQGKYEGVVQVRDSVAGYGQSASRFRFTIGAAAAPSQNPPKLTVPPVASGTNPAQPVAPPATSAPAGSDPAQPAPEAQPVSPSTGEAPVATGQGEVAPGAGAPKTETGAKPDLKLSLSADRGQVEPGTAITYRLEVENSGEAAATGVVVMTKLPAGVSADAAAIKTSSGSATVAGDILTVTVGDVAAGSKATIEIPASVAADAASSLSSQASATYAGASEAVRSNAFIAQVAAPLSGAAQQPAAQPPEQAAAAQPEAPSQVAPSAPQAPAGQSAKQPEQTSPATSQAAPAAAQQTQTAAVQARKANEVPHTGGSFPVLLTVLLLAVVLLARYLRGLSYRRV